MTSTRESKLEMVEDIESKDESSVSVRPEESLPDGSLGHVPEKRFNPKRFAKSLGSKNAWFGDYDYGALFTPNIPWLCKSRDLPFYGVDDELPYLLVIILGMQHALAMVGGLVVPPLLLGGPTGANLGPEVQQYLVSACLIWCAVGTAVQISRHRIPKTKYYFGTGLISVVGTSFTFANIALKYFAQSYENGTCPTAEDGTKLPCPREFGAVLGTGALTGVFAIALCFVPPKAIKKAFPPLVIGTMITFIGASLVSSGITNWAGGSGPCKTDHSILCTSGSQSHHWGSAQYLGLGFSCFAVIVICEVFGSAFMKSASVFIGFVTGMIIAAATGYFNGEVIRSAPGGTFLFVHTFPLGLRGQLVLPMLASWAVIVAESIGNITASAQVSNIPLETDDFMSRVQGGMLADAVSATLANLCTITPLTTFAQNSAVIALTRNASRRSGFMCAALLFIMGIVGKFGAIFVAAPPAVIGGFTTFLFGSVAVSGIRIMAFADWTRRDRFVATAAFAFGLASLVSPHWFNYIFTYQGDNTSLQGFLQAIVLVVEEPYLISSIVGVFLNLALPAEIEETHDNPERADLLH